MGSPNEILEQVMADVISNEYQPITDLAIVDRIAYVCESSKNRSGVRVLMACTLAKIDRPEVDIRKPYTEIGDSDVYSGRAYDEKYITSFIDLHRLPVNNTTAWLTPAWRNHASVLSRNVVVVGTPRQMYMDTIALLNDVHEGLVAPNQLLSEVIQRLITLRDKQSGQVALLLDELKKTQESENIPLSSEDVVTLVDQHLKSKNASRLPVLVVAAAYRTAEIYLQERVLPLESHNAADKQTGSLGDVEITLLDDNQVVTSYEMKDKRVTINDLNHAVHKVHVSGKRIDNYLFITTEVTEQEVHDYARSLYESTGGIEFAIIDCVSFLRHFVHLFHRLRIQYLDTYQELLLAEPDSAVSPALKRAFLDLRINAQASMSTK